MNRIFCFLFLIAYIVVLLPSSQTAFATIVNIPDDYATIQAGIDASVDGDTVLVQPDTYVENINFNGHNVTLGSLFLTTQDTSYILVTIIDGGNYGSVVTFENGENTSATLIGFLLQYGFTDEGGGGINCNNNSSPSIISNYIMNCFALFGGGIGCRNNSNPIIDHNIITKNVAEIHGAGIACDHSSPYIINTYISHNILTHPMVAQGGGIALNYANPYILYTIIFANSARDCGGILCSNSSPTIINCISYDNVSTEFGSISCAHNSSPLVINSILWDKPD